MVIYDLKGIYVVVRFWKVLYKDFFFFWILKMKFFIILYVKIIIGDVFLIRIFFGKFLDGGVIFLLLFICLNKLWKVLYVKWRLFREKMN